MSTKIKPEVRYIKVEGHAIKVGSRAIVFPIDHPNDNPLGYVSNTKHISTSPVITYSKKTGRFETLNTIYTPFILGD